MKLFLTLSLLFVLVSCNKQKRLQGEWNIVTVIRTNGSEIYPVDQVAEFTFNEDEISIRFFNLSVNDIVQVSYPIHYNFEIKGKDIVLTDNTKFSKIRINKLTETELWIEAPFLFFSDEVLELHLVKM